MQTKAERLERLVNVLAKQKARALGSTQVQPEHLLLAMLDEKGFLGSQILIELKLYDEFKEAVTSFFKDEPHIPSKKSNIARSERFKEMLKLSKYSLDRMPVLDKDEKPGTDSLLMACAKEKNSLTYNFFIENEIDEDIFYNALDIARKSNIMEKNSTEKDILDGIFDYTDDEIKVTEIDKKTAMALPFILGLLKVGLDGEVDNISSSKIKKDISNISLPKSPNEEIRVEENFSSSSPIDELERLVTGSSKSPKERAKEVEKAKEAFLESYGRDLTKLAKENKADPVIGRDKEIQRLIQILSRRTKNNPVLTGEPGVGKTSVVEGLAQKIANGDVPINLINKKIYSLDLTSLVA